MLTILVLFVGLTLATAVIAYWSDNLGKKLGKKRVSLWGMRPRTTATFLTIASSWLIMSFTLGVMLTLFPLLRQSLLNYEDVKKKENALKISAKLLTGQVGDLSGQLATLTNQTTLLKTQVKTASDNLRLVSEKLDKSRTAATAARTEQKAAEKEAATARKNADDARARAQSAEKRERAASDNLKTVTAQRDATQQQRNAAQSELKMAQSELNRANADVKTANARVAAANGRVQVAQNKTQKAQTQFKQAQTDLTKIQTDLAAAKTKERAAVTNAQAAQRNAEDSKRVATEAETRATNATTRANEAARLANDSGRKVLAAQNELDQLQNQRKELIRINAQLADAKQFSDLKTQLVQGNDIRVPVGFTLVARTFEPGLSFTEATQRLRGIFSYAADKVLPGDSDKGIPPILPGATLRLATQPVLLPKANDSDPDAYVLVKEDDIYNSLATAISRSQTPLSVRLVADRNHLEGEPFLDTRFIIVPERPALPADTELARATFDEKFSDARLFSALLNLADTGREVARQNGVTPPLSPDAKDFYAPGSNEQIFEALRKISAMGGRARVSLVTDKAISTTDQLSVRFDIEPLAPANANANATASASRADARKAPA